MVGHLPGERESTTDHYNDPNEDDLWKMTRTLNMNSVGIEGNWKEWDVYKFEEKRSIRTAAWFTGNLADGLNYLEFIKKLVRSHVSDEELLAKVKAEESKSRGKGHVVYV
jgi:hypothetical protein